MRASSQTRSPSRASAFDARTTQPALLRGSFTGSAGGLSPLHIRDD